MDSSRRASSAERCCSRGATAASWASRGSRWGACRESSRCSAHWAARERESKNTNCAPSAAGSTPSASSCSGSGRSTSTDSSTAAISSFISAASRSTTTTSSPLPSARANHWATSSRAGREMELTERMSTTSVSRASGRPRLTRAIASTWLKPR